MRSGPDTASLLVLAWHSISSEPGPTSIPRETFAMQLEHLVACGYTPLTLARYIDGLGDRASLPRRAVLLSFDDGFADFASDAWPLLARHAMPATVFVPTGRLGECESWDGTHALQRPLLGWDDVRRLAAEGVEFGGHGVAHRDLTRLGAAELQVEVRQCADDLAAATGRRPRSFAAPYGRVDARVRAEIAGAYEIAFGTRFDRADHATDRFDVPRIEMHYFRDASRWRAFLCGDPVYFQARKAMRALREASTRLLRSAP